VLTVNGFLTHILLAPIGGKYSFKLDVSPKRCSLISAEIAYEILVSTYFSCNSVYVQKHLKFPFSSRCVHKGSSLIVTSTFSWT
jgi:hypothetical protein